MEVSRKKKQTNLHNGIDKNGVALTLNFNLEFYFLSSIWILKCVFLCSGGFAGGPGPLSGLIRSRITSRQPLRLGIRLGKAFEILICFYFFPPICSTRVLPNHFEMSTTTIEFLLFLCFSKLIGNDVWINGAIFKKKRLTKLSEMFRLTALLGERRFSCSALPSCWCATKKPRRSTTRSATSIWPLTNKSTPINLLFSFFLFLFFCQPQHLYTLTHSSYVTVSHTPTEC